MPSGPKKRRAAAKKKEHPNKSIVERVEISNQKTPDVLSCITISEDVVVQCVLPPIAEKVESEGVSSGLLTSIEPLENIEDEFFQESIEAVEKRGSENDLLTSDEQVEMIVVESVHEPKTVSEMQVLGLLMIKQPVENTEDEIYHDSNLVFAKEGSEMVLSDLTSNDPVIVEKTEDEVFDSFIKEVENAGSKMNPLDSVCSDDHVKNIIDEVIEPIENIVGEFVPLDSVCSDDHVKNIIDEVIEPIENIVGEFVTLDSVCSDDHVKNIIDEVIEPIENLVVEIDPLDSVCSDDPLKNIIDEVIEPIENIVGEIEHELYKEFEKEESEKQVLGLLPNNEPYRNAADGVDLDSNQTHEKEESEILTSDFLTRNDSVKNTIDEVVESIQAFENSVSDILDQDFLTSNVPVKDTIDLVIESNQAVEIAESETLSDHKALETIEDVFVGEEIMWNQSTAKIYDNNINLNPDYQVIVAGLTVAEQEISFSSKEKSNLDSSAVRETLIEENVAVNVTSETELTNTDIPETEVIPQIEEYKIDEAADMRKDDQNVLVPTDPDSYNDASKVLKSDNQQLQELICSCNFGESMRISIQKERVKKFLQEELMATEKWRLDLKKAIDQLVDVDDDDAWMQADV